MIKRQYALPTNDSKIYEQFLLLLNFSLKATPQEREVLGEIIRLNNEYEALPPKQRAKFILSTDMRKEMRERLDIEEKQYNTVLSRVKKKKIFGQPVFDKDNILNENLVMKYDGDGLQLQINLVSTIAPAKAPEPKPEKQEEEIEEESQLIEEQKVENKVNDNLAKPANGDDNIIEEGGYGSKLSAGFSLEDPS